KRNPWQVACEPGLAGSSSRSARATCSGGEIRAAWRRDVPGRSTAIATEAEELLVLADAAVLIRNPAPAPDRHVRVGRSAVFLFGIGIDRLHLAAMPPVVTEPKTYSTDITTSRFSETIVTLVLTIT